MVDFHRQQRDQRRHVIRVIIVEFENNFRPNFQKITICLAVKPKKFLSLKLEQEGATQQWPGTIQT